MTLFKRLFWDLNIKYYDLQKSICELKSIGIEITGRCNLQCRHCYMNSQRESFDEEISCKEWLEFFNNLKKDFSNKISIQVTGGEPIVRADIFIILAHLNKLGFRTSLASNGLLLDLENIKELKKYVSTLSISLDGFEESHNYLRNSSVFKQTVENIKNAKKLGVKKITVKTTVYKNNFKQLKDFYKFIQYLGIDNWHLFAMEPNGRGNSSKQDVLSLEEYKQLCEFIDEMKKDKKKNIKIIFEEQSDLFLGEKTYNCNKYKLCHAGISSCAILHNGDIASCIQDDRSNIYGNIKNDKFKDIWENEFKINRSKKYRCCKNHYFSD